MLIENPQIQARLEQVLGQEEFGDLEVASLEIDRLSLVIEVQMRFEEGKVPHHFRKSKNCLVFHLSVPDYALSITPSDQEDEYSAMESIRSDGVTFIHGRYRYEVSSERVSIDHIYSVNEMNLVDEEWPSAP